MVIKIAMEMYCPISLPLSLLLSRESFRKYDMEWPQNTCHVIKSVLPILS